MSNELQEKIGKYRKELEEELRKLKKEQKDIVDKISSGKKLTWEENRKVSKIAEQINDIQEKLKPFYILHDISVLKVVLNKIAANTTEIAEKKELTKTVLNFFEDIIEEKEISYKNLLIERTGLTENELNNLEKTKVSINNDINDLKATLRVLEKKNQPTKEIAEEITEKENLIKQIEELEKIKAFVTEIENDLNTLATSYDQEEKDNIINKLLAFTAIDKENAINKIKNDLNIKDDKDIDQDDKDIDQDDKEERKNKKKKTKEELEEKNKKLKETAKKVFKVALAVGSAIVIILVAKSCNKNNTKTIDDSKKFETIEGYDAQYHIQYEDAMRFYGITFEDAVDYVNRSVEIQQTNFYTDASINDIVGVVKAIDDKAIFKTENDSEKHSINNSLTEIYNNYAFTENSKEKDIERLQALKSFAKENSDLDKFLTEFARLTEEVLKTNSEESKINVYKFLDTFANTFAGNISGLTNVNDNAVVTDTYDWNTAYTTFIKPLMSMYITEGNIEDFICLQTNLLSNYEQWAEINLCNEQTLKLTK